MTAGPQLPSTTRRLTTLFLCLLAAWLGFSAVPVASTVQTTEPAPGPFVVRVQQEGSGQAIESAIVRLGGRLATTGADGVATLDGVPAGSYALLVERHGFDDWRREDVRLGEGAREPLDVRLVPSVLVKLEGTVTTQEGHSVAGARLELHSLGLGSGREARAVWSTTWDGRFTALEMPIGSYEVSVTAAGCEPLVRRFELGPEPAPLELVLSRTLDEAALRVHVTDAKTSEPIANASVTVAEAWPVGVLAQGTTDASGSARFERLLFTRRNRLDTEGRIDAGGGRGSVHVEAEGHETLVVSYPLPLEGTLDVAMEPVDELEEVESNDVISSAQLIRTGAPVRFSTHENGDQDWFRFHLQERAHVVVSIDEGSPVWYRVHVLDSRGSQLTEISVGKGAGGSCALDLERGDYFVHLHAYYDREASETSHVLRVTRQVGPDPWEPNDAPDAARRLRDGEEARGTIFPLADRDHYRFSLERPGRVRLSIPAMDVWRRLELFDGAGQRLTEASGSVGQPLELVCQLAPGSYVALVRQYYDRGCSLTPYSLRLEVLSDDSVDDPEDRPGARLRCARTLALGETAGATIFPVGDVDRWSLALPEPGVLHARLVKPLWCKLLLRGQNGEVLTQATAGGSEPCGLSWHCPAARGVVLEVRAYYDREESTDPYLITTWWEPADEVDLLARNETVEDAFPVFLGEPLRGTIFPLGDHDVFRLEVDHPGRLTLEGEPAVWVKLLLRDAKGTLVNQTAANVGQALRLVTPVLPGSYDVETHAYYDREASAHPYVVRVRLDRAEPDETVPLAASPVRAIALGELVPFAIDQDPDHDRFRFLVPQKGPFFLWMRPTVWVRWRLFDEASGQQVREGSIGAGKAERVELSAEGPTRYLLEVQAYYERESTLVPSWLTVDTVDRPLVGGLLLAEPSAEDPREVRFTLNALEGLAAPARASLDADGDGRGDLTLTVGQPATHRYARQGLYVARATVESTDGRKGETHAWVHALGTVPREGVHVVVQHPAEGATIEGPEPCRVRAISYTGGDVRRVDFSLDGRVVATSYTPPFEAELPWETLGAGEHRLSVRAVDARGEEGASERTLTVSEYFGLLPEDAATITGDDVAVSWTGPGFGRAAVRYRKQGEEAWTSVEGERARARRVVLRELDPETTYEIQPLGDGEPGPVQRVTRVRGLAFGRDTYSARIERDYDQRLGVSIRNHADVPMRVSLTNGEPPAESELLVSFIGEGSEGVPIDLGPGEERDFLLALSAQDVNVERVRFPIRIQSETGFADEAEVVLDVRLPEVKLRWEELPTEEGTLARAWMLHNDGDALTDLFLRSASPDLYVEPELDHGIFPAGESFRVEASPRLYEGFEDIESQLEFGAVAEESTLDVALALPEGKTLFGVQLVAGAGALDENDDHEANLLAARSMAGAYLNPDSVDWSQRTDPEDTDEDGRVDRWSIDDELEGILWVGDDTDGDGEVDFVHADIGSDGQYDYSAYRVEDGWQQTNLVEAWLEMGFSLGQARTSYKRHDLDLVMNGTVVGELRDVIPEGNYTFRLPPTAIRFDKNGVPSGNEVEIRSKHLNGGHYVVGSDFRIKVRMTGTRVWTVADSEEDAREAVLETEGLSVDGPDYSVSSAELEVTGKRERGEPLLFSLPVRNVGATRTSSVAVALMKDVGGGRRIELARTYALDVPLTGSVQTRIPWTAAAGAHTLWVVLDPEHETGDTNDGNDAAAISFEVPGDEGPPSLSIVEPEEGATFTDTVVPVIVEASDDDVVLGVEIAVGNGLPVSLSPLPEPGRWSGRVLLQPGGHRLTATAHDGSNNVAVESRQVSVDVPLPTVEILRPPDGVKLAQREVEVELRADESAKVVAARVNGGPWVPGRLEGGTSVIEVPLTYGDATIEVQATNDRGARATASVKVHCGEQPEEKEEEAEDEPEEPKGEEPEAPPPTTVDVDGVGEVDALGPENRPLPPTGDADGNQNPTTEGPSGASSATTGGGDVDSEPERPRVGSAPATGAQPPGLPPVRELPPPVEEEDDDSAPPEPDPEATEPPAEEPAPEPELEPGEVLGGPQPPVPASQRPRASRPPGGFIGARARQNDWYCTNRPKIKVKFRLPDWLKNKKLPKPGTKEFDAMMVRLLTDMQMRGFKTGKLEAFQKALLRRIKGMNQPGELPGFLESFNIGGPAPEDRAGLVPAAARERRSVARRRGLEGPRSGDRRVRPRDEGACRRRDQGDRGQPEARRGLRGSLAGRRRDVRPLRLHHRRDRALGSALQRARTGDPPRGGHRTTRPRAAHQALAQCPADPARDRRDGRSGGQVRQAHARGGAEPAARQGRRGLRGDREVPDQGASPDRRVDGGQDGSRGADLREVAGGDRGRDAHPEGPRGRARSRQQAAQGLAGLRRVPGRGQGAPGEQDRPGADQPRRRSGRAAQGRQRADQGLVQGRGRRRRRGVRGAVPKRQAVRRRHGAHRERARHHDEGGRTVPGAGRGVRAQARRRPLRGQGGQADDHEPPPAEAGRGPEDLGRPRPRRHLPDPGADEGPADRQGADRLEDGSAADGRRGHRPRRQQERLRPQLLAGFRPGRPAAPPRRHDRPEEDRPLRRGDDGPDGHLRQAHRGLQHRPGAARRLPRQGADADPDQHRRRVRHGLAQVDALVRQGGRGRRGG